MTTQHTVMRMLACFERDAITFLRQVDREFDAQNREFDDEFRQIFVRTSTDR